MTTVKTTRTTAALRAFVLIVGFAGAAGLSACNTMRGAGQDVSAAGHDVARGANAAQNAIATHTGASRN